MNVKGEEPYKRSYEKELIQYKYENLRYTNDRRGPSKRAKRRGITRSDIVTDVT